MITNLMMIRYLTKGRLAFIPDSIWTKLLSDEFKRVATLH
jgi:hypothetical protein